MSGQFWQYAAGSDGRDYSDIVIDNGVLIVGPGELDLTDLQANEVDAWFREPSHVKRVTAISNLEVGDTVVLRRGISRVIAVGRVVKDRASCESLRPQFEDVLGWNLAHVCRIDWHRVEDDDVQRAVVNRLRPFSGQASTLSRCNSDGLRVWAEALLRADGERSLPEVTFDSHKRIEDLQAPEVLTALAGDTTLHASFLAAVADFRGLANMPNNPSEHEVVAHIIVPWLRALGWSNRQMALEYRVKPGRVDIAVFNDHGRDPLQLAFLVEAKKLQSGLDHARGQAEEYNRRLHEHAGLDRYVPVLVSDGQRYQWFESDGVQMAKTKPLYLNLERPTLQGLGLARKLAAPNVAG